MDGVPQLLGPDFYPQLLGGKLAGGGLGFDEEHAALTGQDGKVWLPRRSHGSVGHAPMKSNPAAGFAEIQNGIVQGAFLFAAGPESYNFGGRFTTSRGYFGLVRDDFGGGHVHALEP